MTDRAAAAQNAAQDNLVSADAALNGASHILSLGVLETGVCIVCADPAFRGFAAAHYGAMPGLRTWAAAALTYVVGQLRGSWRFTRNGRPSRRVGNPGELLLLLDQDVIVELQKRRPDLYFVHAAVLARGDAAVMLVAESGGGKSTTAWALVHHGFEYLSDEVGPVDLPSLVVHPYPRALLLKRAPPGAHPLPERTLATPRGLHVPADLLPAGTRASPAPLRAIFFLRRSGPGKERLLRQIGAAEATARLYANTLNALAHPGHGLDAAVHIATRTPCFELITRDLPSACGLVSQTVANGAGGAH